MTYQEVITEIQKDPSKIYIGFLFRFGDTARASYFAYCTISVPDLDDSEWISVYYEGGYLFSDDGEESFYSSEDAPEEVKNLHYKRVEVLPDIDGDCSEYALFKLFPELQNPDDLLTDKERFEFVKLANELINIYIG